MTFRELQHRFEAMANGGLRPLAAQSIQAHDGAYIKAVQDQLLHGLYPDGTMLEPYRLSGYAEMKLRLNPRGVTDLKLTGAFYRGMFLTIDGQYNVKVDSTDSKTQKLKSKYDDNIMVLGPERLADLKRDVLLLEYRNRVLFELRKK